MKKNYTILILSIITTVSSIVLLVFFLRVIENKNKHASLVQVTLEEKFKEKEDSVVLADRISEIKSLQDFVNNYFVDKNRIDTFVDYLEKIGPVFGSDIAVENIEITDKNKDMIFVELLVVGTFEEVMNTVSFVENIPYQINIKQIYLNKEIKDLSQDNNKTTLSIKNQPKSNWQANVSFSILSSN